MPASRGLPIDGFLVRTADKWGFDFRSPDHKLLGRGEEDSKTKLLAYIEDRRENLPAMFGWLTAYLVTLIFSFLGWRREVFFEKKAEPPAPANASEPRR